MQIITTALRIERMPPFSLSALVVSANCTAIVLVPLTGAAAFDFDMVGVRALETPQCKDKKNQHSMHTETHFKRFYDKLACLPPK